MNLVAAMRGQYQSSEKLLWAGIAIKVVIYLAALGSAIWIDKIAAALFLVVACLGQVSVFCVRYYSHVHNGLAERLRRLAMLQDGIGREVSALETAVLEEKIWSTPPSPTVAPYYSSTLPRGPKRLVDVTAECAFYSGSISNAAWRTFLAISIATSSVLLLTLVLLTIAGTVQSKLDTVAKGVLIGITFWMTEDFFEMALKYRSLGISCEHVLQECSRLLEEEAPSLQESYEIFQEYDSAFANMPPLPRWIYGARNQRLSAIWRKTHPSSTVESRAR